MLWRRVCPFWPRSCRLYSTTLHSFRSVQILPDSSLDTFRRLAFKPALPTFLPRGCLKDLPAASKWFVKPDAEGNLDAAELDTRYLSNFGSVLVPLEISNNDSFGQVQHSLNFFLECVFFLYLLLLASSSIYAFSDASMINGFEPDSNTSPELLRL